MAKCVKCGDTGVIETGNNDLPCDCPAGDTALFNTAGGDGPVTGKEMRRHFLNDSPEPILPGPYSYPSVKSSRRAGRLVGSLSLQATTTSPTPGLRDVRLGKNTSPLF